MTGITRTVAHPAPTPSSTVVSNRVAGSVHSGTAVTSRLTGSFWSKSGNVSARLIRP